jgi:hypothetical protein
MQNRIPYVTAYVDDYTHLPVECVDPRLRASLPACTAQKLLDSVTRAQLLEIGRTVGDACDEKRKERVGQNCCKYVKRVAKEGVSSESAVVKISYRGALLQDHSGSVFPPCICEGCSSRSECIIIIQRHATSKGLLPHVRTPMGREREEGMKVM